MRKACRSRTRNRSNQPVVTYTKLATLFSYAQGSSDWREWNYREISQSKMRALIEAGEVEEISRKDDDGRIKIVGYKATKALRQRVESPTSLTPRTMLVAAKIRKFLDPRDVSELEKYWLWPYVGDNRAAGVHPRQTAAGRIRAEKLLGMRRPQSTPAVELKAA